MRNLFSGFGAFLRTPVGVILATNALWHIVVWTVNTVWKANIPFNYVISLILLGVDIFAAFYLRDQLIYFFSQFTLPVQNQKQRQELAARVRSFESGRRGPALFIKNGRGIMHEGEAKKRGAGVIVLDTASALVLRTDTEITDTVGPGIKFTSGNEYIAGSVDLRAQWQFIGPLASDQPFLNPATVIPSKSYNELQHRRQQTSGLTRDGFEVCPTISIKFRIRRPVEKEPSESGVRSQYGYSADAVRKAITREVIQLGTTENKRTRMEWNRLPAHLVVNLWREYIRKFKFSELFKTDGPNGLQTIEEMINKRVRHPNVVAMDDAGSPSGEWVESLEFRQLESRGLEIMEVRIHNVLFEPEIENQVITQWSTEWMNLAKREEAQLKEKESLIETASRDEASKNFARIASRQFGGKVTHPQQNPFKTLQLLVQPLREFILFESTANAEVEKELRKLEEIWKWLLDQNPDGTRTPPEGAAR